MTAVPRRAFAREVALVVAWFLGFTVYSIGVCNVLDPYVIDSDIELTLLRDLFVVTGVTALAIT